MKNIVIEKEELFEEFLAIFSIGLTYCLEKQIISPKRAEEWLFSPSIAYSEKSLKKNNVGLCLINALKHASELEACYGADYYTPSVIGTRDKFIEVVKNSVNKNDYKNEKIRLMFLDIFQ